MADHSKLIAAIEKQLQPVLELSSQAIYVYVDDGNKICNKHFSDLLGYASPQEWANVKGNFPSVFVAEKSQHDLIGAFQDAMGEGVGSKIQVEWKKKSGGTVKTDVILVPISVDGHLAALHFISAV